MSIVVNFILQSSYELASIRF